jgi:hypothetical protein
MRIWRLVAFTFLLLWCLPSIGTAEASHARKRHTKCPEHAAMFRPSCHASRRAGLVGIKQVPPHILRRRSPDLDDQRCRSCLDRPDAWHRRSAHRTPRPNARPDLVEALRSPPNAATTPVLNEANIPAIPDVPPIVILQPKTDRDREIRAQQQQ